MNGAALIMKERQEQIQKHGYTSWHDDEHADGEILQAASSVLEREVTGLDPEVEFPWEDESLNKILGHDKIGRLTIVGALIAAEIDRLRRHDPR